MKVKNFDMSFVSRNITEHGNNSICDNCANELDGVCKSHWRVHLSSVTACDDFIKR